MVFYIETSQPSAHILIYAAKGISAVNDVLIVSSCAYGLWKKNTPPAWRLHHVLLTSHLHKWLIKHRIAAVCCKSIGSLQWWHNEHDGVSNHQPHDCLLNRLFGCRSKKTSKLRVTGLCAGNSPVTGEVPAQMASYAENVSIWWRHHDTDLTNVHPHQSCKTLWLAIQFFRNIFVKQ